MKVKMIDPKIIRESPDFVIQKLKTRGEDPFLENEVKRFVEIERERRKIIRRSEELKRERNANSKRIAQMKMEGQDPGYLIDGLQVLSETISKLDQELLKKEQELKDILLLLPNLPDDSVPKGADENCNVEIRKHLNPKTFDFPIRDHVDIARGLNLMDLDRAAKISGARFPLFLGLGARLIRALISFMLDLHIDKHKYNEVWVPLLVNKKSLYSTGQLPKFSDDLFFINTDDLYLIPTAEVPVTNVHRNEILDEDLLPISYVAYTPCFRREAGSYGRDVRGLVRQHQFDKIELVKFVRPEASFEALEELVQHAEEVLISLELPYRVVALSTGDLGFASMKTYDLEVWLPSQYTYREISSCSNCGDFQARRGVIRFKDKSNGKNKLVHILNGSGVAIGRAFAAILENGQQEDGTVVIPKALRPYMSGISVIKRPY